MFTYDDYRSLALLQLFRLLQLLRDSSEWIAGGVMGGEEEVRVYQRNGNVN